ncbi:hypothetical protein BKA64DRAFT_61976 [Cadophora sp. MPI-SDFR-AT-0126]|nr:hypothetical protein BKA64DRAFT_61976 [Leotiomycetes sp. MPI-SDFR-AT-0126]
MAIENINQNSVKSIDQEMSFLLMGLSTLSELDWEEPVCIYAVLFVCIAILVHRMLKSRERIRRLEGKVSELARTNESIERMVQSLREEMLMSREVDREEKLCLVENVKQVMRQGNGSPRENSMTDELYSGSQHLDDPIAHGEEICGDDAESGGTGGSTLEDTSCPWCSHAHLLRLGGCTGDQTCDGSVHIPYCPSCFYNEGMEHGQERDTACLDGGTTTAAEMTDGEASAEPLDDC